MHAALLLFLSFSCSSVFASWTPDTYPNPTTDTAACHRGHASSSWICDADGLLSKKGANVMEGVIKLIADGESPYAKRQCGSLGPQGYEVAVAVAREIDTGGRSAADAAKDFAEALHAKWGVGSAECQNGVLLLLAVANRQIYISTGAGTTKYLGSSVLDEIIGQSKPFLREKKYDEALQHAVVNIGLALAGKSIKEESETSPWVVLAMFLVFGGFCFFGHRATSRCKSRYQSCRTMLERIKRDQAALQEGSYTVTSCPICLEDFQVPEPGAAEGDEGASAPEPAEPSAPASASEDASAPLINRKAPKAAASSSSGGVNSSGDDEEKVKSSSSGKGAAAASAASKPGGAAPSAASTDGDSSAAPVRRTPLSLPCGHLFCEPCLSMWLEQRKTSCPICRADMRGPSDDTDQPPPPPPPCQDAQSQWESDFPEAFVFDSRTQRRPRTWGSWRTYYPYIGTRSYRQTATEQARELYRQDLMFRLQALRRRFPDIVTPSMANSWANDVASGRGLNASTLRDFQLRDPAVRSQLEGYGSSGASRGFGGGGGGGASSSAGGRGGSW